MRINAARLREYLDSMHVEADARDLRSDAIRDIVKSARGDGYDGKTVRKIFVRERMDDAERKRGDEMLEVYEQALGGKGRALAAIERGVPAGEAAKANGVHRATVARARHVAKQVSNATLPAHDPDTGEVSPERQHGGNDPVPEETQGAVPAGAASGTGDVTTPQPDAVANTESCGPCPVPSGSVSPQTTEMASDEGVSSFLAAAPRGHALAGCDGALADNGTTTQCEDRASPGPQDTPAEPTFAGPLPQTSQTSQTSPAEHRIIDTWPEMPEALRRTKDDGLPPLRSGENRGERKMEGVA